MIMTLYTTAKLRRGQHGETVEMAHASVSALRLRTETAREFRLIYALAFVYFLPIALVARFLPSHYRSCGTTKPARRSVIDEARATAGALVPFAFMR